jgi:hypothetical protein
VGVRERELHGGLLGDEKHVLPGASRGLHLHGHHEQAVAQGGYGVALATQHRVVVLLV